MATPLTNVAQALTGHLAQVFAQYPIEVAHGDGVWLHARDGRKILDFYGGHAVAGLGYGHPRWLAALERQARQTTFQTNALPMAVRERAAARLAKFAGLGLDTVFWINSGAEANENALKLAFKLTGRSQVAALEQGFHGRTAAAGAVTWGALEKWYGFPRTPFGVGAHPHECGGVVGGVVTGHDAAVAPIRDDPVGDCIGHDHRQPTDVVDPGGGRDRGVPPVQVEQRHGRVGHDGDVFGQGEA